MVEEAKEGSQVEMAKRGVPTHPKTFRLARRLGIESWAAVGLLECLWHWCSVHAITGVITADAEDMADGLRYNGDAAALMEALVSSGWVDRLDDGRLVIHDASSHADNTWKANLKRAGLRFWDECDDGAEPDPQQNRDSVTTESQQNHDSVAIESQRCSEPPEPEPEPISESKLSVLADFPISEAGLVETAGPPGRSEAPPPTSSPPIWWFDRYPETTWPDFDAWWAEFARIFPPRAGDRKVKDGRDVARRLLRAGRGDLPDRVLAGLARYRAWCEATGKVRTEFVQQMPTWLRSSGWEEPWEIPDDLPRPAKQRQQSRSKHPWREDLGINA